MHGLPDFRETLEVLDRNRVECILVGGVAAVLQGETKQQAGRNKDLLALPILRETLRLREVERDSP
jgi:hypothetical protein